MSHPADPTAPRPETPADAVGGPATAPTGDIAPVALPSERPGPSYAGPVAGLTALEGVAIPATHRVAAVRGELLARAGDVV